MIDVIAPVVQVVTSGVDWPAIAAAIATGVVGIAGIVGTSWQGKRAREGQSKDLRASIDAAAENLKLSIGAETERARLTEKRRIYAQCLGAFGGLMAAATKSDLYREMDPLNQESDIAQNEHAVALIAAHDALSQLQLIAPTPVQDRASKFMGSLLVVGERGDSEARKQLLMAMRADLGEPVSKEEGQLSALATSPGQSGDPGPGGG